MVAHTTQFAQPGWHFADGGGCTLLADKQGSAVSYISPSGKDISIVIETAQSNVTNTIEIKLTGAFVQLKQLHVQAWPEHFFIASRADAVLYACRCSTHVQHW